MNRAPRIAAGLLAGFVIVAAFGQRAVALAPEEVVVVANFNQPDSVKLAKYYAQQRSIPERNIVFLKTATGYEVSRERYDKEIRPVVLDFLEKTNLKDTARCLVLMYGVPVRVARPMVGGDPILHNTCQSALGAAERRIVADYDFASSVTMKFPKPPATAPATIEKLFEAPSGPPRPPANADRVLSDAGILLAQRQRQAEQIEDPANRAIAINQILALEQDLFGLTGLISHIQKNRPQGAPDTNGLQLKLDKANALMGQATTQPMTNPNIKARIELMDIIGGAAMVRAQMSKIINESSPAESDASVDSELSMLYWDKYELQGPIANPMFWRAPRTADVKPVLMTCRIDGPSLADAMRIVNDSIEVQKTGLSGVFYIDAGGSEKLQPTALAYDVYLRQLYRMITVGTGIKVVFDDKRTLLPPGSAPDAALYVGWYSLENYVPAFTWNKGAVGWHIASFEGKKLRDPNSSDWGVKMIQGGVAATILAVNEPRLSAFPLPGEFFGLLLTGKWTLAECYWRTNPSVSWRMTLVADPLYNPFEVQPQLSPQNLPVGLLPVPAGHGTTRPQSQPASAPLAEADSHNRAPTASR